MSTCSDKIENPSLRLARYLKEFVGLRSKTVRDVEKYESVIWFGEMPQDPDCRSGAWADAYERVLGGPRTRDQCRLPSRSDRA